MSAIKPPTDTPKEENEKQALEFVRSLALQYFEKRNMGTVQEYMEERTSWIGTGRDEFSRNLAQASRALLQDAEESEGALHVTQLDCETASLDGSGFVVYGTVSAKPENSDLLEENVRFTAVVEQTQDGMRLLHLHFSHADYLQEQGHYYVSRTVVKDNLALRNALAVRAKQLENLTKNIPGGAHQCANDANLTLLSMSDGFLSMFGYTKEEVAELFQNQFVNMIYPGDRAQMLRTVAEQMKKGPDIELEYRVLCKHGQPVWILDKGRLMDNGEGGNCFYCLLVEINGRKREQEELRLTLERHQVIMDQATDIIFEWDIRKDTLLFSHNWRKKFGYYAINEQISGLIPMSKNIHPDDMTAFVKIMKDTLAGVPYSETEFRIRNVSGIYIWCRIRATAQYDENDRPIKAVGVIVDIDHEKQQQQALLAQAQRDALTNLYNKAAIQQLIEQSMEASNGKKNQALLIIDVDDFKKVNDTYGHLCGDSVLSDVAGTLRNHFRSGDLVGRIGGDEFLVYLPDTGEQKEVAAKAKKLLEALHTIKPQDDALPISCSIGIALFPQKSTDYLSLYKYADDALYRIKAWGKNDFLFFSTENCGTPISGGYSHSAVGTIDSEAGAKQDDVGNKLAQYVFRMLYTSIDINMAVRQLLEIVGRAYDVSRVYIFESTPDKQRCNNTFEWCNTGVQPEIDKLQNIDYEKDLGGYLSNFDKNHIFYCTDIRSLHTDLYNILAPQGICSLLQCAIMDDGEFMGYVGFDECRANRLWTKEQINSLTLISNVLSTFLLKLRLKEQLAGKADNKSLPEQ